MGFLELLQEFLRLIFGLAILDLIKFFMTLPLLYYVVAIVVLALVVSLKWGFHFDIDGVSLGVSFDFEFGGLNSVIEFFKKLRYKFGKHK